jgi:NosR/NirI family nitrous oxide reductase transcriptional regulator
VRFFRLDGAGQAFDTAAISIMALKISAEFVSAWVLGVCVYAPPIAVRHAKNMASRLTLLILFCCCGPAAMAGDETVLQVFADTLEAPAVFPGADRFGDIEETSPVMPVYKGSEQLGYVFITSDFVNTNGYSGKPIHILVAVDMQGVIRGIRLLEHAEPIVLIGIPETRIEAALEKYVGQDIAAFASGDDKTHKVDAVSGATVTIMVMDDTILNSTVMVARAHRLGGLRPKKKRQGPVFAVDPNINVVKDWQTLVDEGAVAKLVLTVAQVNEAFEVTGNALAIEKAEQGAPDDIFIELYAAVVSIPSVGRSILGEVEYRNLIERIEPGQQAIVLAGDGRYSFKGSGYVRGGIFDRFQINQNDQSFRFHDYGHKRLRKLAAEGSPNLKDVDLFKTDADMQFDPAAPWQLELLVGRPTGPTDKVFTTFDLTYTPPEAYLQIVSPAPDESPAYEDLELWQKMWVNRIPEIIILMLALVFLTGIFFFQNWFARRPKLLDRIRIGYLLFTLFGIGWYAKAQLSVVNLLSVFSAGMTGFDWGFFLMEPLIFILWGSVLIALLFWGRGPFCGWLCPFGALQELMNRVAKLIKIPQVKLPWGLHERLWAIKYIIFLVLLGFSMHSLALAERLAEAEPFKTVIILKFIRDWPFVLFALAVLVPGLFIERFYCRYLCALGAALAIPGRLRMFEWLKRYKECGTPCQRCSNECMVQAIHHEGNINVNECVYCLHCQVVYFNDHQCPVVIQKRLKHERRTARASVRGAADVAAVVAELKAKKAEDQQAAD